MIIFPWYGRIRQKDLEAMTPIQFWAFIGCMILGAVIMIGAMIGIGIDMMIHPLFGGWGDRLMGFGIFSFGVSFAVSLLALILPSKTGSRKP